MTIQRLEPFKNDPWYLKANRKHGAMYKIHIDALRDMGRIQLRQDLNLLLNVLYFILCTLQVNDLDGNGLLRALIVARTAAVSGRG